MNEYEKTKAIELNQQQIEAYKNGATRFLFPIRKDITDVSEDCVEYKNLESQDGIGIETIEDFIYNYSPLEKGDKFFIQEDFTEVSATELVTRNQILNNEQHNYDWQDASQMQEHQARFKYVVLDVEIKKINEMMIKDWAMILNQRYGIWANVLEDKCKYFFNSQFDVKYEDNPYVFIYTVKGNKVMSNCALTSTRRNSL